MSSTVQGGGKRRRPLAAWPPLSTRVMAQGRPRMAVIRLTGVALIVSALCVVAHAQETKPCPSGHICPVCSEENGIRTCRIENRVSRRCRKLRLRRRGISCRRTPLHHRHHHHHHHHRPRVGACGGDPPRTGESLKLSPYAEWCAPSAERQFRDCIGGLSWRPIHAGIVAQNPHGYGQQNSRLFLMLRGHKRIGPAHTLIGQLLSGALALT